MSLNKTQLKQSIVTILTAEQNVTENPTASIARIADGIAQAIDVYIKQATIVVNTTGTATAQTGTGTIT